MSDVSEPLPAYKKDQSIETLLADMNALLEPIERTICRDYQKTSYPTIFILGLPRSGHTLAGQLLIQRFHLTYPSNFIARFWRAPVLGARLQRLALDQSIGPQIFDEDYKSEHGLTFGPYGLHEFGYFWSEVFQFGETHLVSNEKLALVDRDHLLRVVAGLEHESGGLPVLFKNGTLGFQARFLAELFPRSVFIFCQRDPLYTAQSLLQLRLKRFNRKDIWFSFRPEEYLSLRKKPWWEQIAGQVVAIQQAVKKELEGIDTHRVLFVQYEELCEYPLEITKQVAHAMELLGHELTIKGNIPDSFDCRDEKRISDSDFEKLRISIENYSNLNKS